MNRRRLFVSAVAAAACVALADPDAGHLAAMDGDGPARQLDAIQNLNRAHNLSMGQYILEDGVSGTVEAMNRDGFAHMIAVIAPEKSRPWSLS